MAENDLPDAPWATPSMPVTPPAPAADPALPDAPWTEAKPERSLVQHALSPITTYPETYQKMNKESVDEMKHGVGQIANADGAWDVAKGVGNTAMGAIGYVGSPINAAYRTVVGQPVEDVTGIPKEYTEFAASLATPGIGLTRIGGVPKTPPKPPTPQPFGVTKSVGQETGDLSAIQREQAALRGEMGPHAQERAKEFFAQQKGQLEDARTGIKEDLDPAKTIFADSPVEAGEHLSESIKKAAKVSKGVVDDAYQAAREAPGYMHPSVFEGLGSKIKTDLSLNKDPYKRYVIDDTTPSARSALKYIDDEVSRFVVENQANPFGNKKGVLLNELAAQAEAAGHYDVAQKLRFGDKGTIGLNGEDIDQIRKNLNIYRRQSYKPDNPTDFRATQAIIDNFDKRIADGFAADRWAGDPNAARLWNEAHAANTEYRNTFRGNNPAGKQVEKVTGIGTKDPAIPNDVIDMVTGASGTNPNTANVNFAKRAKEIAGESSPAWSAVRQGTFSRLIEPTGEAAGAQKTYSRLHQFLNGSGRELSNEVYNPAQRRMLQEFADLQKQLVIPREGANWSGTGAAVARIMDKIGSKTGMVVGAGLAHMIGPGIPWVTEAAGAAVAKGIGEISARRQAAKIAKQLPLVAEEAKKYRDAYALYLNKTSPGSQARAVAARANLVRAGSVLGVNLEEDLPDMNAQ